MPIDIRISMLNTRPMPTNQRAKGNQMNEAIAALAATLYGQDAEAVMELDAQERAEAVAEAVSQ